MQDIVFYVAANKTIGKVREFSNMNNASAPVLTLGVSVCLRMRLFADVNTATPYPIASFSGIADWQWSMDSDFDRSTACKLVADAGGISVHTTTDTVNGETVSFTEFEIQISNMNTEELAAWLGVEKTRSGLTGELVGYDNGGNAVFVLQIEDFSVRNRISGLGDPTAVDEGFVTRTVAEQMIQTAVSSSAAAKQDKLTSANGGTGISVTSAGIISVSDVPQNAVTGLSASLGAKQNNITAGDLIELSGATVNRRRYMTVRQLSDMSTISKKPAGSTVTRTYRIMAPGNAYKLTAVGTDLYLTTETEFASGGSMQWGIESHLELFIAGTGRLHTDANVILADALAPDSVNNCTVRFHNGRAIISVEDHIAGCIVTVNAATNTEGTLKYYLQQAPAPDATYNETQYIAVDASLNGQTLNLGGAITNSEKHVVGNGYADTILTGGVSCTSKTTFANLSMDGVVNSGGTMTLGDVYIPSGATVSVSGGGLAVEKVTGAGETSVIDLGGTNVTVSPGMTANMNGCTFANGSASDGFGGAINVNGYANITGCTFTGNNASQGGNIVVGSNAVMRASDCTFSSATATWGNVYVYGYGSAVFTDCAINGAIAGVNGRITFAGSCTVNYVGVRASTAPNTVTITSGAILDLTGNTRPTPIAPGGGITFEAGGATVFVNGGTEAKSSSYMMDNVTLPTVANLTNTNVVNLNSKNVVVSSGATANASNVFFSSGHAINGGVFEVTSGGSLLLTSCHFTGETATRGGVIYTQSGFISASACYFSGNNAEAGRAIGVYGGTVSLNSCTFDSHTSATAVGILEIRSGALVSATNCTFRDSAVCFNFTDGNTTLRLAGSNAILGKAVGSGSVIISSGAIVDLTENTNADSIKPGGGITIPAGAVVTILGSGGSSGYFSDLAVTGTTITNLGRIYGATVTVPPLEDPIGPRGPWILETTEGQTNVSAVSGESQQIVVAGGLCSIIGM